MLAKSPVAGRVKTRLSPTYTPEEAAELAAAALSDTLEAVRRSQATRRLLVIDGPQAGWQRPGLEVFQQRGTGLDERIAHAFSLVPGPALLIGMDTPQVTPALLSVSWDEVDAWFGPAADGGFWALGFARPPDPGWLLGVPMSVGSTGACQRARLVRAGLVVGDLPELTDVDLAVDVATVAAAATGSRFAAVAAELAVCR